MELKYKMGVNDWLERSDSTQNEQTFISKQLWIKLVTNSIQRAYRFYSEFFNIPIENIDYEKLTYDYEEHYLHAISLGLFQSGGIREKDHLNLWCLSQVFLPEVYIESGVFIGSSLHAFINTSSIKQIYAIDPNINRLNIPKENLSKVKLISDQDFSQIKFNLSGIKSLVYFDDHINTAKRIIQASEKGLQYLLFDDSTGLEGICQRLYPALPTIPMIINSDLLSPGDKLHWSFSTTNRAKTRVKLNITEEFINECNMAKSLINSYQQIPNLGEMIPQLNPEKMNDQNKYLIQLK